MSSVIQKSRRRARQRHETIAAQRPGTGTAEDCVAGTVKSQAIREGREGSALKKTKSNIPQTEPAALRAGPRRSGRGRAQVLLGRGDEGGEAVGVVDCHIRQNFAIEADAADFQPVN